MYLCHLDLRASCFLPNVELNTMDNVAIDPNKGRDVTSNVDKEHPVPIGYRSPNRKTWSRTDPNVPELSS